MPACRILYARWFSISRARRTSLPTKDQPTRAVRAVPLKSLKSSKEREQASDGRAGQQPNSGRQSSICSAGIQMPLSVVPRDLAERHAGMTVLTAPKPVGHGAEGIVVEPLSDTSWCFETSVILRSDDDSKLANEFARSFVQQQWDWMKKIIRV
jgi:hypothetical protein